MAQLWCGDPHLTVNQVNTLINSFIYFVFCTNMSHHVFLHHVKYSIALAALFCRSKLCHRGTPKRWQLLHRQRWRWTRASWVKRQNLVYRPHDSSLLFCKPPWVMRFVLIRPVALVVQKTRTVFQKQRRPAIAAAIGSCGVRELFRKNDAIACFARHIRDARVIVPRRKA